MALSKKYRCLNVGNCETANQNKVFEIAEGTEPVCPDCGKNMLVEVKGKKPVTLILVVLALVAVAGVVAYSVLGGSKEKETKEAVADQIDIVPSENIPGDSAKEATPEIVSEVVEPTVEQTNISDKSEAQNIGSATKNSNVSSEKPKANPKSLDGYSLGWGRYSGPASNGKPDGLGGEIVVTGHHTLDLHDGGKTIEFSPGDKITRVKIKDGKLLQGLLTRPDNSSRHFSVGV